VRQLVAAQCSHDLLTIGLPPLPPSFGRLRPLSVVLNIAPDTGGDIIVILYEKREGVARIKIGRAHV
jgi:hypothetical protein